MRVVILIFHARTERRHTIPRYIDLGQNTSVHWSEHDYPIWLDGIGLIYENGACWFGFVDRYIRVVVLLTKCVKTKMLMKTLLVHVLYNDT